MTIPSRGRSTSRERPFDASLMDLPPSHDLQQVLDRRAARAEGRRLRWLFSLMLDFLWGYGEKPSRLFLFSIAFSLIWAGCYFFAGLNLGGRCVAGFTSSEQLAHFGQCVYFSFVPSPP